MWQEGMERAGSSLSPTPHRRERRGFKSVSLPHRCAAEDGKRQGVPTLSSILSPMDNETVYERTLNDQEMVFEWDPGASHISLSPHSALRCNVEYKKEPHDVELGEGSITTARGAGTAVLNVNGVVSHEEVHVLEMPD